MKSNLHFLTLGLLILLVLAGCTIPLNDAAATKKASIVFTTQRSTPENGKPSAGARSVALSGKALSGKALSGNGLTRPPKAIPAQMAGTRAPQPHWAPPRFERGASQRQVGPDRGHASGRGVGPRSAAEARDLNAATDIASMSFRVIEWATGKTVLEGPLDPGKPFLNLWVEPNRWYRVSVDVVPTSSAPGAKTGVIRYGDQADFWAYGDGRTTYVDLWVHPTVTPIFDPTTMNKLFDPVSGTMQAKNDIVIGTPDVHPMNKFFYGPDAKLYYFEWQNNTIYQWADISQPLDLNTPFYDADFDNISIWAVCADPYYTDSLWFVGLNAFDEFWIYYLDTSDPDAPSGYAFAQIDGDMAHGLDPSDYWNNLMPSGIAVDLYGETYVTYNTWVDVDATWKSGVLEYSYWGDLWSRDPDYGWEDYYGTESFITDVTVHSGMVYASVSPVYGGYFGIAGGYTDIWVYDTNLYYQYGLAEALQPDPVYQDPFPAPANSLWAPAKFLGSNAKGDLILSQFRPDAVTTTPWTPRLSAISTDLDVLEDLP